MTKRHSLILALSLLVSLSGCEATNLDGSTSIDLTETNYYLTGDFDLGGQDAIPLLKNGDTYTYSDVKLRRGNSFRLASSEKTITYDHLSDSDGFAKGDNGYIRVLNEGYYDLILTDGDTPSLTMTKTDSTYTEVSLVASGTSGPNFDFDFVKNDDFTFDSVGLAGDSDGGILLYYRMTIQIFLDDEPLGFDAFQYNDIYNSAFRFFDDRIEVMQTGYFNFHIDFSLTRPLVVTSEDAAFPTPLPEDADAYDEVTSIFEGSFKEKGTKLEMTSEETVGETTTTKTYLETIDLNQHYYEETQGLDDDAPVIKRNSVVTNNNFYDIRVYENSTATPTLTGYKIGTAPESASDASTTTVAQSYLTKEAAITRMLNADGIDQTILQSFDCLTKISHLHSSEYATTDSANYRNSLEIEAEYIDYYGDGMNVKARNIEKYVSGPSSKAIINEAEFNMSYNKVLQNGTITFTHYQGNIFDGNNDILPDAIPTRIVKYEFNYTFETRENVANFSLDPARYVINDITYAPTYDATAGTSLRASDLSLVDFLPTTGIDLSNYRIMEFDPAYLTQDVGDPTSFTPKRGGSTTVKVGNLYNDVTATVTLNISYLATASISISPSTSGKTYYLGLTYEFTASVNSYGDPVVTVTSADPSIIRVAHVDSEADQVSNNKAVFRLEMMALSETPVTITIASKNYPSITTTLSIAVTAPLTFADVADSYYVKKGSDDWLTQLNLDGSAVIQNTSKSIVYEFSYVLYGDTIILDESETLGSFTATMNWTYQEEGLRTLTITSLTSIDGENLLQTVIAKDTWSTSLSFYSAWYYLVRYKSMISTSGDATMTITLKPRENETPIGDVLIIRGEERFTFTWLPRTSENDREATGLLIYNNADGKGLPGVVSIGYKGTNSLDLQFTNQDGAAIPFNIRIYFVLNTSN